MLTMPCQKNASVPTISFRQYGGWTRNWGREPPPHDIVEWMDHLTPPRITSQQHFIFRTVSTGVRAGVRGLHSTRPILSSTPLPTVDPHTTTPDSIIRSPNLWIIYSVPCTFQPILESLSTAGNLKQSLSTSLGCEGTFPGRLLVCKDVKSKPTTSLMAKLNSHSFNGRWKE